MYVTDVLGTVNNCYAGQFLDDGNIELLGALIEKYRDCDELD